MTPHWWGGLALFDRAGQHGDYLGVRAGSLGTDEVEAGMAAECGMVDVVSERRVRAIPSAALRAL
jgi:hypothetical protein